MPIVIRLLSVAQLFVLYFWVSPVGAADNKPLRVAILDFVNQKGSEDYQYLAQLSETAERYLSKKYKYDKTSKKENEKALEKILDSDDLERRELSNEHIIELAKEKDLDVVIFGYYEAFQKSRRSVSQIILKPWFYFKSFDKMIPLKSFQNKIDASIFAKIDEVASVLAERMIYLVGLGKLLQQTIIVAYDRKRQYNVPLKLRKETGRLKQQFQNHFRKNIQDLPEYLKAKSLKRFRMNKKNLLRWGKKNSIKNLIIVVFNGKKNRIKIFLNSLTGRVVTTSYPIGLKSAEQKEKLEKPFKEIIAFIEESVSQEFRKVNQQPLPFNWDNIYVDLEDLEKKPDQIVILSYSPRNQYKVPKKLRQETAKLRKKLIVYFRKNISVLSEYLKSNALSPPGINKNSLLSWKREQNIPNLLRVSMNKQKDEVRVLIHSKKNTEEKIVYDTDITKMERKEKFSHFFSKIFLKTVIVPRHKKNNISKELTTEVVNLKKDFENHLRDNILELPKYLKINSLKPPKISGKNLLRWGRSYGIAHLIRVAISKRGDRIWVFINSKDGRSFKTSYSIASMSEARLKQEIQFALKDIVNYTQGIPPRSKRDRARLKLGWLSVYMETMLSMGGGVTFLGRSIAYAPKFSISSRIYPLSLAEKIKGKSSKSLNSSALMPLSMGFRFDFNYTFNSSLSFIEPVRRQAATADYKANFYSVFFEISYYFTFMKKFRFLTGLSMGYYLGTRTSQLPNSETVVGGGELTRNPVFGIQNELSYLLLSYLSLGVQVEYLYYHNQSLIENGTTTVHYTGLGILISYLL